MTPRTLSLINAAGCLALTVIVVTQWRRERTLAQANANLRSELDVVRDQAAGETRHRIALERDIAVLKESIEATQVAAESSATALAEKDLLSTALHDELAAARAQVTAWEAALKARDERIRTLDADLIATRKRLDDAVSRLKAAGAR
jgi:predicted  nucleic acid-binding Zn-ribbon protein